MDKRQLTLKITEVLNSSTLAKVDVSFRDDKHIKIVMISNSFDGKTFSERFSFIDDLISETLPTIYKEFHFRYEAFTKKEMLSLPLDKQKELMSQIPFDNRESAKEI